MIDSPITMFIRLGEEEGLVFFVPVNPGFNFSKGSSDSLQIQFVNGYYVGNFEHRYLLKLKPATVIWRQNEDNPVRQRFLYAERDRLLPRAHCFDEDKLEEAGSDQGLKCVLG